MSESLKLLVTMDRMVSALVCEDHMLQGGWFYDSKKTIIGEEILRIYQELFNEWNVSDKGRWEARHWGSSDYDIEIIKKGERAYATLIRVKWIGSELFLWFYGSLLSIDDTAKDEKSIQISANSFTKLGTEEQKKTFLSHWIKHTP
jgi:hypothetical protein